MNSKEGKRKKKRINNFFYDFVKVTGIVPASLYFRVKLLRVSDKVPKRIKGGALIAPNHSSLMDPVITLCAFMHRRIYSLATKDLYSSPAKRFFFNGIKCIQVDKANFTMSALHDVCDRLKDGRCILIFPEGTVAGAKDEVKSYKSGMILMAHLSKVPIIPVYIKRREHWYNRQIVVVGEPIDLAEKYGRIMSAADIEEANAYIREKEIELKEYSENYINRRKRNEHI